MDIYFNELSINEQADHPQIARQWMKKLMLLYVYARKKGFRSLKTTYSIFSAKLAPNYTFSDWLNDNTVDLEERLLFKSQSLKYPFNEDILNMKNTDNELLNFQYRDFSPKGLGLAYLFDTLSISFDNSNEWDTSSIIIEFSKIVENDSDITVKQKEEVEVKHSSKITNLNQLNEWIINKKKQLIDTGKVLWLKRNELFPHLEFCDSIRNQLSDLKSCSPKFIQIIKRLFELEEYCANWVTVNFNPDELPSKVTPESDTRKERFRASMTFSFSDGIERECFLHSRYTPGAGRIHFYPDNSQRKCYIGYIGNKIL